jgi:murein L,D-transpeptidase YafK
VCAQTELALLDAVPKNTGKDLQPSAIIGLSDRDTYVLLASLNEGSLQLFENNQGTLIPKLQFPMSIGKEGFGKEIEGDKKTPVGVYRITSFLNDEQLDDFYGRAAYPLNYPNAWDLLQNRTGSGIWLHAMPEGVTSRPALDSDGCIVINNEQIEMLAPYLDIGRTRIVLTDESDWLPAKDIEIQRKELESRIDGWKVAWESLKADPYLNFYSDEYNNLKHDKVSWDKYKRRVNGAKKFIKVEISDLAIFSYPGAENLVMTEFYQSYVSNNYRSNGWKKQLWKKEVSGWKIIYEAGG